MTVVGVPTLDEIAAEPTRADALPREAALVLATRCAAALAALQIVAMRPAPPLPDDDELLDMDNAVKVAGVSRAWWEKNYKHELPPTRYVGRLPRWSRRDLRRWATTRAA